MAPDMLWDRFDISNVKHHKKRATFSKKKKKKKACPYFVDYGRKKIIMSVEMMTEFSALIELFL